jgi:hypothetical protein
MSNIFNQLELEAFKAGITPRTKQSIKWFRNKAETLVGINRRALMNEDPIVRRNKGQPEIGDLMLFFYDPKFKRTLPYYDTFPLTVVVGPAESASGVTTSFYGLNLHYLPPTLRAKLFDALLDNISNKKYDETTKIMANYELLKSSRANKYFAPCFKQYLVPHVKSRFAIIQPTEWEIAAFLPTAQFKKASEAQVWKDSRKMLR